MFFFCLFMSQNVLHNVMRKEYCGVRIFRINFYLGSMAFHISPMEHGIGKKLFF